MEHNVKIHCNINQTDLIRQAFLVLCAMRRGETEILEKSRMPISCFKSELSHWDGRKHGWKCERL